MKTIVITGSTRGIGRGLAEQFLARGCRVVVSARSEAAVAKTVGELSIRYPNRVAGFSCDVTDYAQIEALWAGAKKRFGRVDVWINNAGISIHRGPLAEANPADIASIVSINLTGTLLAARVAIPGMKEQGGGQIWNMEGFGSQGTTLPGMTSYGATKRAVRYLTESLQKEVAGSSVHVCTLSPGIVVTDLLIGDYDLKSDEWKKAKKFFNILGDKVETVTPWLAEKILAANHPKAKVAWLTTPKVLGRFLTAGFKRRELFKGIEGA